jgi:multimeric flavodoxin WrbA
VVEDHMVEFIDLQEKNIHYYNYQNHHMDDDFIPIAEKMVEADVVIFATPVYWYAMSGILKTFFDRFTDLITVRKDLGRALKHKKCYLICAGAAEEIPEGFEIPFEATCKYLDMEYKGSFYYYTGSNESLNAQQLKSAGAFSKTLFD